VTPGRTIYLEPFWKFHAFGRQLIAFPPSSYEFVAEENAPGKLVDVITRSGIDRPLLRFADSLVPAGLVKSLFGRWTKTPPGTSLTYAWDHVVFRPQPWVVEVEYASLLLGIDPKHLRRFRLLVERALGSPHCRRIICWSQAGSRSLLSDLDCHDFEGKIEIVHYSVPRKTFCKGHETEKVKLLFVGSGTNRGAFDYGGGRETLQTFFVLRQRYRNIELVMRSDVPPDVRRNCKGVDNLRIIEEMIPREELEREFLSADIFMIPSHNTSPMIMLDAMSYELPLVTIDAWANAEYVKDGQTGLVAPKSARIAYFHGDTRQPNFSAREFVTAIKTPDPAVVVELVRRVGFLIENPELRRRLGRTARFQVEEGSFSLTRLNEKLGTIFDEAINRDEKQATAVGLSG
jgi:glycosyltransferase involved in cell wall biosynthesis